jgi:hypothetical protein
LGEELLRVFKVSWIFLNINRKAGLQRIRIEIATFKPIAAGKYSERLSDSR